MPNLAIFCFLALAHSRGSTPPSIQLKRSSSQPVLFQPHSPRNIRISRRDAQPTDGLQVVAATPLLLLSADLSFEHPLGQRPSGFQVSEILVGEKEFGGLAGNVQQPAGFVQVAVQQCGIGRHGGV